GPFGEVGLWQLKQMSRAGLIRSASFGVPCESWQLEHVTPRRYITLCTKSLPCMRFLCAVPSAKCVKVVSPSLCSSSSQYFFSSSPWLNPTGQSKYLPSIGLVSGLPCEWH